MDPVKFADEVQQFASGLAQDTLDRMEVYRLENESFKQWALQLGNLLEIGGNFRDWQTVRSEISDKIKRVIHLRKGTP